jgi:hypothetical protein
MIRNDTLKRARYPDSSWPDLRHKYRRLAIPAVVAAVIAEKGGRVDEERQHAKTRAKETRAKNRST